MNEAICKTKAMCKAKHSNSPKFAVGLTVGLTLDLAVDPGGTAASWLRTFMVRDSGSADGIFLQPLCHDRSRAC